MSGRFFEHWTVKMMFFLMVVVFLLGGSSAATALSSSSAATESDALPDKHQIGSYELPTDPEWAYVEEIDVSEEGIEEQTLHIFQSGEADDFSAGYVRIITRNKPVGGTDELSSSLMPLILSTLTDGYALMNGLVHENDRNTLIFGSHAIEYELRADPELFPVALNMAEGRGENLAFISWLDDALKSGTSNIEGAGVTVISPEGTLFIFSFQDKPTDTGNTAMETLNFVLDSIQENGNDEGTDTSAKGLSYDDYEVASFVEFARSPKKYIGKDIQVSGSVIQVMESPLVRMYLVAQDGNVSHIWYVYSLSFESADRILEDDIVTVYGTFGGLETYTTVMGAGKTVPRIDALFIRLE